MQPRVATRSDVAEVSATLGAGFSDDPVMTWAFGTTDRIDKITAVLGFMAEAGSIASGTAYMVDGAVSCWSPPDAPDWSDGENGERFVELLISRCDRGEMARLDALGNAVSEGRPTEPHWYLGMIATIPAYRGQGRGSQLLEATLAIVDDAGLPAFLESTNPRNQSLYLRYGFRVTGEIPIPDGPTLTAMRRPPAGRQATMH